MKTKVDAGALGAAVPEKVADRFERRALAKQVNREGVAQAVRPLEGDGEAATPHPGLEHLWDSCALERALRGSYTEKDLPVWQLWPTVLQVIQQGITDFRGQGKLESCADLGPANVQAAHTPLHIVQRQGHDFPRPQAIGSDE